MFGTGREKFDWTTELDAARYSVAIIESPAAHEGGCYAIRSGSHSLREIKSEYESVRNVQVKLNEKGSIDDLQRIALQARHEGSPQKFWEYIGYFYQLYTINGSLVLRNLDNDRFPEIKVTSLCGFLQEHPEI